MMSNFSFLIFTIVISAAVMITRALSFVLFPAGKNTPKIILFLGKALPCALMALLVVYCLKGVTVFSYPHGIPELISIAAVVGLHIWKRNTLLSIVAGTILYMFLVQMVF